MEGLSAVLESLPYILSGIPVTLGLVALSLALGFTLGVPMAVATVYGNRVMAKIIQVFVFVMRGLPNLVLLFLFYFGIFPLLGWNLSPFVIGVITLGLRSAAYQTEIFRGAILLWKRADVSCSICGHDQESSHLEHYFTSSSTPGLPGGLTSIPFSLPILR